VPSNYIGNFGIGLYEIKNTLKMLFILTPKKSFKELVVGNVFLW